MTGMFERSRLIQLRCRHPSPATTQVVFLLTAAATFPPAASIFCFRFFARQTRQAPGKHEGHARQRTAFLALRTVCSNDKVRGSSGAPSSSRLCGSRKKAKMLSATFGPTSGASCNSSILAAGDLLHRAEMLGQKLGGSLSHEADSQRRNHARHRQQARTVDIPNDVRGGFRAHAVQTRELFDG